MKFQIDAFRKRKVIERIEGTIDISKTEVMKVTDAKWSEDGDTTAWYSYIGEAIQNNAHFKLDVKVTRTSQEGDTEYDGIEIEW